MLMYAYTGSFPIFKGLPQEQSLSSRTLTLAIPVLRAFSLF